MLIFISEAAMDVWIGGAYRVNLSPMRKIKRNVAPD
jgi:hypothetical protein